MRWRTASDAGRIVRGTTAAIAPSAVVASREDRQRFWAAIRRGLSSEDATGEAGVSPAVGARWFRDGGACPRSAWPPSRGGTCRSRSGRRSRSCALGRTGPRDRPAAAPLAVDDLAGAAAQRRDPRGRSAYRATDGPVARGPPGARPKAAKLAGIAPLRRYVQDRLAGMVTAPDGRHVAGPAVRWGGRRHGRRQHRRWATAWSPEQIAKRLPLDFPDDDAMRVSHEAIYQALYVQGRGALRRELTACLRTGRALRVPRARTRGRGKHFVTADVLLSQRPAEARTGPCPVTGKAISSSAWGARPSARSSNAPRASPCCCTSHACSGTTQPRVKNGPALAGHGAEAVRDAIAATLTPLPEHLRRSLTWDQGTEMAQHAQLRLDTGLPVFFCDPHSPWQRGTNENTNGLLRQYFPKGTDLGRHGVDDLAADRGGPQRPAAQDARVEHSGRSPARSPIAHTGSRCCDDPLNPRWQPRSLWWTSPAAGRPGRQGQLEGVQHQLGAQVVGHRPAHHAPAEGVQHRRQVQPALLRRHIRDVGQPQAVRRERVEVRAVPGSGRPGGRRVGDGGAGPPPAAGGSPASPGRRISRATRLRPCRAPGRPQLGVDPRAAVGRPGSRAWMRWITRGQLGVGPGPGRRGRSRQA